MLEFWPVRTTDSATAAVFAIGAAIFLLWLALTSLRNPRTDQTAKRSTRSVIGIALQGLAFFAVSSRLQIDPSQIVPLLALAVGLLMVGAVGLFVWSTFVMGRNWGIVAQTRSNHDLVTAGPFRFVRNPIYLALTLFIVAMALTMHNLTALVIALPLYGFGTYIRVREEERLLGAQFGAAYEAYTERVKRFVPGIF